MIDLVRNNPYAAPLADLGNRGEFILRNDRAGGVCRAGNDDALGRRFECLQRGGGQLEAHLRPAGDLNGLKVERAHRVAIGHIAWPRHGNPVARIERGRERQNEGGRGATGDDHPAGAELHAKAFAIMPADALLEGKAFPIAHRFAVEHAVGRINRRLRRPSGRLAELHMQHALPGGFQFMRAAADRDRLKRRNILSHREPLCW